MRTQQRYVLFGENEEAKWVREKRNVYGITTYSHSDANGKLLLRWRDTVAILRVERVLVDVVFS